MALLQDMHDPSTQQHAPQYGGGAIIDAGTIETLRELGGEEDPGLVLELIELFLEDATDRMQTLARAWSAGDLETVGRCAHALKSASANIGALDFSGTCRSVESAVKSGEQEQSSQLVERCLGMYSEVQGALGAMRGTQ